MVKSNIKVHFDTLQLAKEKAKRVKLLKELESDQKNLIAETSSLLVVQNTIDRMVDEQFAS